MISLPIKHFSKFEHKQPIYYYQLLFLHLMRTLQIRNFDRLSKGVNPIIWGFATGRNRQFLDSGH